jgi:hypothetical protein
MQRLWELVKQGKRADEIINTLDISDMEALKQALQQLMQEKGETVAVAGLMGEPALRAQYTDRGIRIDPQMLDGSVFRPGDAFDVKVSQDQITLVKSKPST